MLTIFQRVAASTPLLICSALLEVFSIVRIGQKSDYLLETFGGGTAPDLWFRVPSKKLYSYLAEIGDGGREAYLDITIFDFFPYMPAYTLFFGSLLYLQCETAGISTRLSLVFVVAVMCDVIETAGFHYATKMFRTSLEQQYMIVISTANVLKWISLGIGFILLLGLIIKNWIISKWSSKTAKSDKMM
eukprot:scaffold5688_cov104-Cylindrotheca_fusiformis.AAC.4